jgi:hypothetical protein
MKYIFFLSIAFLSSCYSFKGISIPNEINTYYVQNFENRAPNAPVEADVQFSEALRNKIRNESKLKLRDIDADITFEGEIVRYDVLSEAPVEGNTIALNKLIIDVQVRYINNRNEKDKYDRVFSFFRTFPGDQDLQTVQAALNKDIFDQLTERIFNDTFTTW